MIVTNAPNVVRNQLFSDVLEGLKLPCPCDISLYPLEIRGMVEHGRGQFDVRILGYSIEPFQGPHLVCIGDSSPFWVQSLTCFKKNFFGFKDRLSFERSLFVKLPNSLIRLKNIRFIVTLPRYAIAEGTYVYKSPIQYIVYKNNSAARQQSIVEETGMSSDTRRKSILKTHVEKLLNVYKREFPCRLQCVQKLTEEFTMECTRIIDTMRAPLSPIEEGTVEQEDGQSPDSMQVELEFEEDLFTNMTEEDWENLIKAIPDHV